MKTLYLSIIVCLMVAPIASYAQFGLTNKLKKRTQDKLERKIEDKIVEELSEELARMAFKPIDNAMDDLLRSSYEEQEGGEVDWEKSGQAYSDFLKGLNASASVPKEYVFDLEVEAEIRDYDKEKHKMTMLFSKGNNYMGMQQDQNGKETLVVIDNVNDIMVMYSTDKDGKKSAQALPSMNKLAAGIAQSSMNNNNLEKNLKFNKIDKQKKIAGYLAQGYTFDSDIEKGQAWIAVDFPVSYFEVIGKGFENMMPKSYTETVVEMKGMVMESEYENKDDKKIKSSFKVKKVKEEKHTIINSEWGLTPS